MARGLISRFPDPISSPMKAIPVSKLGITGRALVRSLQTDERIVITHCGKPIACLTRLEANCPIPVDWSQSPTVQRDRSSMPFMSAEESLELVHTAASRW